MFEVCQADPVTKENDGDFTHYLNACRAEKHMESLQSIYKNTGNDYKTQCKLSDTAFNAIKNPILDLDSPMNTLCSQPYFSFLFIVS